MPTRRDISAALAAFPLLINSEARAAFAIFQTSSGASSTPNSAWVSLPVGGGGNMSKLAISAGGLIYSGTDTTSGGGVMLGSTVVGTLNTWLATENTIPAAYQGTPYLAGDCYGLGLGASGNLYFIQSPRVATNLTALWKSINQGASWTKTNFPFMTADGNENARGFKNNQVAEDPNNANVVYLGGPGYLQYSLDGGTTISTFTGAFATAIAAATTNGVNAIVFDKSLGTTTFSGQTVTAHVLVSVTGSGIWHTLNGGSTWALISGSPTDAGKGWVGSDGWAYFLGIYGGSGVSRIAPSTYAVTTISGTANFSSVALNPADPALAWLVSPGYSFYALTGALNGATAPSLSSQATSATPVTSAPQAPWLTATNMFANEMVMDPLVTTSTSSVTIGSGTKTFTVVVGLNLVAGDAVRCRNTPTNTNYMLGTVASYSGTTLTVTVGSLSEGSNYLGASTGGSGTFSAWTITKERAWIAHGSGIAFMDAPSFGGTMAATDQSGGTETLTGTGVIWPPGYNPLLISSDFPFHAVAANPIGTTGLPLNSYSNPEGGIADGTQVCYAWNAPGTLFCCSVGYFGKSTNGGMSWTALAAAPSGVSFAYLAAATTSNIVAYDWQNTKVFYTTNGGTSWTQGGGTLPAAVTGFPFSNGIHSLCVDDNGYYYLIGNDGYVYKSTNGGATWAKGTNQCSAYVSLPQLRAVPGFPSHLLYCDGEQSTSSSSLAAVIASHPATGPAAKISLDGGNTWTSLPNSQEIFAINVGKAKPGGNGYPSIFLVGWVSNVYDVFRIDSLNTASISSASYNATSGGYAAGHTDLPNDIAGSMDVWDFCIVAQASGWTFRGYTGTWP